MPNFDWRDHSHVEWANRFPDNALGASVWRTASLESAAGQLFSLRAALAAPPSRPCVFVSHRQADVSQAERIAYLACQEGFEYWLDVLDPNLAAVTGAVSGSQASQRSSQAVAAIIEMALLNSTHVVAVITQNTKGSMWVPYEYGRVKDPKALVALQAACWVDSTAAHSLPEYLHLGPIHRSESDIRIWLKGERHRSGMHGVPTCSWSGGITTPL